MVTLFIAYQRTSVKPLHARSHLTLVKTRGLARYVTFGFELFKEEEEGLFKPRVASLLKSKCQKPIKPSLRIYSCTQKELGHTPEESMPFGFLKMAWRKVLT